MVKLPSSLASLWLPEPLPLAWPPLHPVLHSFPTRRSSDLLAVYSPGASKPPGSLKLATVPVTVRPAAVPSLSVKEPALLAVMLGSLIATVLDRESTGLEFV